ncbi:MAG: pentapeptide repeat-containing protein, partial [Pikeienuella sp.]
MRRGEGAAPKRALRWVSAVICVALTWGFGWLVLGYALLQSFPARNEWLSLLTAFALLFAIWVGLSGLLAARVRVGRRDFGRDTRFMWRMARFRYPFILLSILVFGFAWIRTEGGIEGYFGKLAIEISSNRISFEQLIRESAAERLARHRAALPRFLTTRAFGEDDPETPFKDESISGIQSVLSDVNLAGAHLTEKPANWMDRETAELAARRAWCDRRDMTWDLCVQNPEPYQIAARKEWCGENTSEPKTFSPLDGGWARSCAGFFAGAERAFQSEWSAQRADYLSVLAKPDLRGKDLRGAMLASSFLPGANLGRARMEGADLSRARLEGANLAGARIEGADISWARMEGADLSDARMEGAKLEEAQMEGADLGGARMERAYLRWAKMKGTNLTRARLEDANLEEAQMEGADLSWARLERANLGTAKMKGTDLRKARMEGAYLGHAQMEGADLRKAQMEEANLRWTRMEGADFRGASLRSTEFSGATISASLLNSADFTDAQGLTQSLLEFAIGDQETILPLDAETGKQLFVWSCWPEKSE